MLKSEAVALQKEYQPKLRNGINIAVDLVNQVQQDKKDGDVDIRVRIAPNNMEEIFAIVAAMDLDKALNHVKYRELDAARKKGIVGCHDMTEFAKDYKNIKDPKTVYDPQEWTDSKLREALKEAVIDAASRNNGALPNTNPTAGRTNSGYTIMYNYREGKITSFWFA